MIGDGGGRKYANSLFSDQNSSIPGSRNWQVETADWIWPVSSSVF